MGKDKGERENGKKWKGRGFAPICSRRKGAGVHLRHHQVQLTETSRPVVVIRVGVVRVFESRNGGHHRVHQLEDSRPVKFGRRKPPDGATLAPTRRRREWACAGASWVHTSFCVPEPHWIRARGCTIAIVHCVALDRPAPLTTFDRPFLHGFVGGMGAQRSLHNWLCWRNGGLRGASYSMSGRWVVRAH
ncbi:hypothetical protein GQ457_02G019490 [Hibiscus cannabinus]